MKNNNSLREHVLNLLDSDGAHANFETAVKNFPVDLRGIKPKGAAHSAWEVLEHLRITQWDILEFTRNPKHLSPEFPKGYWPSGEIPPDQKAWDKSSGAFQSDLKAMRELIAHESTDLLAAIPHGDGKTVLREALLLADHNAYHLGELVLLRRLLNAWEP